jgi:hypothetical protein
MSVKERKMESPGSSGLRSVEQVIEQLHRCGKQVRARGGGWMAQCPAHEDRHASLSIRAGERGEARLKCYAGCDGRDVLRALFGEAVGSAKWVVGSSGGTAGPIPSLWELSTIHHPLPTSGSLATGVDVQGDG